jgi:two-component system sensor histidine kinase BarA
MSGTAPANAEGRPPDAVPVLVADDIPTNVFVLTAMLRSLGVATLSAADGAEAVQIATERRPALIFMDLQMPRMDGITAARHIRDAMPDQRVPIVAVTAFPEIRHLPDFEAAEFDDFLVKPVDLSVLRRAVDKWLPQAGANGQGGAARA